MVRPPEVVVSGASKGHSECSAAAMGGDALPPATCKPRIAGVPAVVWSESDEWSLLTECAEALSGILLLRVKN